MPNSIIDIKEETVTVKYVELTALIDEIKGLREDLKRERKEPKSKAELLTAKDIMTDLGISRKTLDRRMYESENPLPMVLEGHRLKIRRDTYEAWKSSMGL